LVKSSNAQPVRSVSTGSVSVGRTKRPHWELSVLRREGDRTVLLCLQGQLYFGSGYALAEAMQTAVGENNASARTHFYIISFAAVSSIDASAADQLKSAKIRASSQGFKIICCRMNSSVFKALSAAGVVTAPDPELLDVVKNNGVKVVLTSQNITDFRKSLRHQVVEHAIEDSASGQEITIRKLGEGDYDAFDTDIDAFEYCGERLVQEFCYAQGFQGSSGNTLEPYMLAYRQACTDGARLSETDFEAMNCMPSGSMSRLKEYCEISPDLKALTELKCEEPALFLIMRGSVAIVQDSQEAETAHSWGVKFQAEVKGYSGRGGKKLRYRYTPGHVCGKREFFLGPSHRLVAGETVSDLVVSKRHAAYAEIWQLKHSQWVSLPVDLRQVVSDLCLLQMADDWQQTLLMQ